MSAIQPPRGTRAAEQQRKLAELLERKARAAQMRRFERGDQRHVPAVGHRTRGR